MSDINDTLSTRTDKGPFQILHLLELTRVRYGMRNAGTCEQPMAAEAQRETRQEVEGEEEGDRGDRTQGSERT